MAMLRAYADGSAPTDDGDAADACEPRGSLVVAVLHDLSLAARFCTRVLLLDGGEVVDDDRPERVLNARALERHYRVEPVVTTHEGEPLILPWRRLGR
jgi:iron complex transport system ATP-binding protein